MHFNILVRSVVLAILYRPITAAPSFARISKHATHHTREISPGLKLESYYPESSFQTYGTGIDHPLRKREDATVQDAALAFIQSQLNVTAVDGMQVKSTSESFEAKHAYLQQTINGLSVSNAVANVAFSKDNKVVAFGISFVNPTTIAPATPSVPLADAIASAEKQLNGKFDAANSPVPTLEYVAKSDGSAVLAHVFRVRNETAGTWYEAFVDAHNGQLVSVTDFISKFTYRVLPIAKQSPDEGFEDLDDPQDVSASPLGWHNDGVTTTNTTEGNNALVYKTTILGTTEQSGPGEFLYPFNPNTVPETDANSDAVKTNVFFIVNKIHDIAYKYGFTESAFNFQKNNFGKGGIGNDPVHVMVQDPSDESNALFAATPDGESPLMTLSIWAYSEPERDVGLDNGVIAHEYTHGITNRITGGGTARCLQSLEASGLGEGWSDAFADWVQQASADIKDYVTAAYASNSRFGNRHYPFSVDPQANPLRYSSVASLDEPHNIGEVWANFLHNVHASLVDKHGFSATAHTDPTGEAGNIVWLHLFIDALSLQPCNPTFISARDAWLQADVNRYNGAHRCLLWEEFATRGLGQNADPKRPHRDDFSVPTDCFF